MRVSGESPWSRAEVVTGFVQSAPNQQLIGYARRLRPGAPPRVLDIGCGAGRNAVPLAQEGCDVIGVDLSRPMLAAAAARSVAGRLRLIEAPMHHLPVRSATIDLIIAHGIWNLARSGSEFRAAVAEAARVAAAGAALFVFTFSRQTLPPDAAPIEGESFVFTQFSGSPQVFLTERQLVDELRQQGFSPDPDLPLSELNVPPAGRPRTGGAPLIYQGGFRLRGA